jgi:hypothetical protein
MAHRNPAPHITRKRNFRGPRTASPGPLEKVAAGAEYRSPELAGPRESKETPTGRLIDVEAFESGGFRNGIHKNN